jgi:cobalt-zinc-cadmium efflux system membrane fusion protein
MTRMRGARTTRGLSAVCLCGLATLLLLHPARAADDHGEPESGGHGDPDLGHPAFSIPEFERFGVRLATAGPGTVDVGVELPAEVRPNADRIAHIAPRFAGVVREVRKRVGDRVRAGDVLALIESEHLSTFELKAAFDGVVVDKHVAPGEAVTREQPAFIVADLSTVWVSVSVYQAALPQVHVGQPVVVTASDGSTTATGTVSYVAPIVDQATRTAIARIELPNPDGAWRPGLFVTATVFDPAEAPVVVPRHALQTLAGRAVLFVADAGRFAARPVTVGRVGRTTAEITAGLSAGERYAADRAFLVKAELAKDEAGHDH